MQFLLNYLKARKVVSIKVCSLFFKPDMLKADIDVDYVGFRIGKEFVVGYGLN